MANLLRISLKGSLPTNEAWSVNPVWTISDFGVSVTPAQVQAVATAVAAVSNQPALLSCMSALTIHNAVRVEARKATGELEQQAEAAKTTPGVGTGSAVHPFQTAVVVSLRSDQVGASGRGRLYWPSTGVTLNASTMRLSSPTGANIALAMQLYLSAIQTAVRATFTGANLAVWSRKTTGLFNVRSLQVGDVIDTQRRRRDTLVEAYAAQAFP